MKNSKAIIYLKIMYVLSFAINGIILTHYFLTILKSFIIIIGVLLTLGIFLFLHNYLFEYIRYCENEDEWDSICTFPVIPDCKNYDLKKVKNRMLYIFKWEL